MPQTESTQRILQEFETSCAELFQSMNCTVSRTDQDSDSLASAPLTYIDAGSNEVEFVIALQLPMSVLNMTYPKFDTQDILAISDKKLEDWGSELANQLIGRFKNKMLNLGCRLQIGLPALSLDTAEINSAVENHAAYRYKYELDGEIFECTIFIQLFTADLRLIEEAPVSGAVAEGELELF